MKLFAVTLLLILLNNCSFDTKSGIWKNENLSVKRDFDKGTFRDFQKVSTRSDTFDKVIPFDQKFKYKITNSKKNYNWQDVFLNQSNNLKNLKYNDNNKLIFKSKKLTKNKINDFILFNEDKLITSDEKGNLIIYTLENEKNLYKFNFYKKKYKKFKKYLNLYVEKNIIYISDNIGYLYAFDYNKKKIIWAKDYKIPFRGNLKIFGDKIITANQNNTLFVFNKFNGETLRLIPTEETIVKNDFKNNLSIIKDNLFFINTFGSIYSINLNNLKINWFINLNDAVSLNSNNLFEGSEIVSDKNKLVVSSEQFTYILDVATGTVIYKVNFSLKVRPVIVDNYLFLITRKDLLIVMNLDSGKVLFSSDINQNISDFLKVKKYKVEIKSINILNSEIFIFLQNSFFLKYDLDGELKNIDKLPSKINSQPILVNNLIYLLDFKNKLSIID